MEAIIEIVETRIYRVFLPCTREEMKNEDSYPVIERALQSWKKDPDYYLIEAKHDADWVDTEDDEVC